MAFDPPSNRPPKQVFYAERVVGESTKKFTHVQVSVESAAIQLDKTNDEGAEFVRLFEIHQVTCVGQNDAA